MPRLRVTAHLRQHVGENPTEAQGATVREMLDNTFAENPGLRGYLLDDQGHVRHHVAIFVNGQVIADRDEMSDSVPADGEVFVMQALSGGRQ